ncbi:hypothetical protein K431DRAFT_281193 [Polychaeton citri CBS 116435]|uniref:Uncharacterized protein n=1 Tax=Polychaeton citri CBS 116435 TaxID=1314669 RepID=A0A9P4QF21_9PEZI|nr:hypothetical protein K431DRAFT_281193 [Polychaeton citri CBS 116435]
MAVTESRLALDAKESNSRANDLYERNVRLQEERDDFEKKLAEANTELRLETDRRKQLDKAQNIEKREHEQTSRKLNETNEDLQRLLIEKAGNEKELRTLRANLEDAQKDLETSKQAIESLRKASKANEDAYKGRTSMLEAVVKDRDRHRHIAEEEESRRLELMEQIERLFGKNGFEKKPSELLEAAYKDLDEYKQKLKAQPSHDSLPALNYDHTMRGRQTSLGDELGADFGSDISDSESEVENGELTLKADSFHLPNGENSNNGHDERAELPKHHLPKVPVPSTHILSTKRTSRDDDRMESGVLESQSQLDSDPTPQAEKEIMPKTDEPEERDWKAIPELGIDDMQKDEAKEIFAPKFEASPKPKLKLRLRSGKRWVSFAEQSAGQMQPSQPDHQQELALAKVDSPAFLELLKALPIPTKLLILSVISMSIVLFLMEWCAVYGERKLWLAANGATRVHVLSIMNGGGGFSWADMFTFGIESMFGLKRGYLV